MDQDFDKIFANQIKSKKFFYDFLKIKKNKKFIFFASINNF